MYRSTPMTKPRDKNVLPKLHRALGHFSLSSRGHDGQHFGLLDPRNMWKKTSETWWICRIYMIYIWCIWFIYDLYGIYIWFICDFYRVNFYEMWKHMWKKHLWKKSWWYSREILTLENTEMLKFNLRLSLLSLSLSLSLSLMLLLLLLLLLLFTIWKWSGITSSVDTSNSSAWISDGNLPRLPQTGHIIWSDSSLHHLSSNPPGSLIVTYHTYQQIRYGGFRFVMGVPPVIHFLEGIFHSS